MFEVTLVRPAKDDGKELADTIHLHLRPKAGTRSPSGSGLLTCGWIDRAIFRRIVTDNPDESDNRETNLTDVRVNPPGGLKEADFGLPPIDQNEWSFHSEAYQGWNEEGEKGEGDRVRGELANCGGPPRLGQSLHRKSLPEYGGGRQGRAICWDLKRFSEWCSVLGRHVPRLRLGMPTRRRRHGHANGIRISKRSRSVAMAPEPKHAPI